jgi:type I restriction enzyme M protein
MVKKKNAPNSANLGFEEKIGRLTSQLSEQVERSRELEGKIKENLQGIGYEI